jgi:hypothetical protein
MVPYLLRKVHDDLQKNPGTPPDHRAGEIVFIGHLAGIQSPKHHFALDRISKMTYLLYEYMFIYRRVFIEKQR